MDILSNYNLKELENILAYLELPSYKVKQIYTWLMLGYEFSEMSDIDKRTRELLSDKFIAQSVSIKETFESSDGTIKLLFRLFDGALIEGVLMKYSYGNTLCVSTQVGCRMGCVFCASTVDGLLRNLSSGEILGQVTKVNRMLGGTQKDRKITNVVLMGSGEPLDNFDNVVKFFELVSDSIGLNISRRNISLSTCGLVSDIKRLADLNLGVTLTISLHSPFDVERKKIMPVAKKFTVLQLMDAARYYFKKTGRRVVLEYTLMEGKNDNDVDIDELVNIIKGFPTHINCILYNKVEGKDLKTLSKKDAYDFVDKLNERGLSATLRRQLGNDIGGACGQLKRKYEN